VTRLGVHREVEKVVGVGMALLVGLALSGPVAGAGRQG
jgi:hypothetical protein